MSRPKLLYFITEDWYFCSHRLPLALAAKDAGYDVAVMTHVSEHGETIRRVGIRLIPFSFSRRGLNPLSELVVLARLIVLYRKEKPDLVHHVAMKPVLYGSLAARISGVPNVVNALAGLGYVFTSNQLIARLLRLAIGSAFRVLLNSSRSRLILQNYDNRSMFIRKRFINEERIRLVRGSGVDTTVFSPTQEPAGIPVVMLASRMLWDKGIKEFVEAARQLKDRRIDARFVLVGDTDPHNPSAISKEQLTVWQSVGVIEWWGHREDMPAIFSKSHIICLPSFYGEGVPKVLIEAASCGRAIIATDVPGCNDIVKQNVNGLLIPPRNVDALVDSIRLLIDNAQLRRSMGRRGRARVKNHFNIDLIVQQHLNVYNSFFNVE